MNRIGIVVDEVAGLLEEVVQENKIEIVKAKLDWPDLEQQPGENTFQKMRELDKKGIVSFGKTSQPSPKNFLDAYKKQFERFEEIICITITSKLSGTHNSAIQAVKFLPEEQQDKVFVVDSLSAAGGQTLLVMKALDLIKENKGIKEIGQELIDCVPQIRAFLVLKDLKWIEKSGRISSLAAKIARRMSEVGIRPLLSFKRGLLKPVGIKMGAKDVPTALFAQFKKENKTGDGQRIRVVIDHGDDPAGAQRLVDMIEKDFETAEIVFVGLLNNLVGTITGPDTLVLSWLKD